MAAPGNWQAVIEKVVEDFAADGRMHTFETCTTEQEKCTFVETTNVIKKVNWICEFLSQAQTAPNSKNLQAALRLKKEGTACFQKKMYHEAARNYSEAIMKTPFGTEELGILYGNRSATLFYLRMFTECLEDIGMAKKCNFPADKLHKLLTREINCYLHLGDKDKANNCLKQLGTHIETESIDCKLKEQKRQDILKLSQQLETCCRQQTGDRLLSAPPLSHGKNELLVQASKAVDIQHTEEQGRFLNASQNIQKGDTLIVEQPYAAVLLPDNTDTHCHHCFKKLKMNFYPCRRCVSVKFCSVECANMSWEKYHRTECPYLQLLHSVGIAHLSLRVVITAGLLYLKKFVYDQPAIERSQSYKGFDETGVYCRSYQSVYDLLTHSEDMETEDLLQYTLTALLLLEILKGSGWFTMDSTDPEMDMSTEKRNTFEDENKLTEDEQLIGSLLLRHILQLVCNAHAITELQCTQVTNSVVEDQSQVRIATAIYPTASLMNHSCDPSIIASFNRDTLVVRAVKDIQQGQEVFNCYGPHHKRMSWDERQQSLQQQYFFTCSCKPCSDGEKTSNFLYSYRCIQCEGPMVTESSGTFRCQSCGFCSNLDLVDVRKADTLFQNGVKLLQENRNQDAVNLLLDCFKLRENILYKHNKVLSETQDCLARSYASLGNFEESAKFLRQSIDTVKVIYGDDSIETGNELQKLAEILISAHKWPEALDCVSDAIKIFTEHYSESHDTVKELLDMKEQLTQVLSYRT